MKTVQYLNEKLVEGCTMLQALEQLKNDLGIKYSIFDEYGLVVLNYCQIESPKRNEIVRECRSLVLALPYEDYQPPVNTPVELLEDYCQWFQVASRSFDRFFNYGETEEEIDVTQLTFYDKLDGSLIGVFCHNGQWLYRTRSVIMPVSVVDELAGVTWNGLIEAALGWDNFVSYVEKSGVDDITFILEVVSPHNRIVTSYGEPNAYLLCIRNHGGAHMTPDDVLAVSLAGYFGWKIPDSFQFTNYSDCVNSQQSRRNLEEGVVGYNEDGVPVCKVKNPAYVAAHHLRGEGVLTPRRVVDLININEWSEYLAVFPRDEERILPWVKAKETLDFEVEEVYDTLQHIENQKEFALEAIKHPYQSILFNLRKGLTYTEAWGKLSVDNQVALLHNIIKKENKHG